MRRRVTDMLPVDQPRQLDRGAKGLVAIHVAQRLIGWDLELLGGEIAIGSGHRHARARAERKGGRDKGQPNQAHLSPLFARDS